ncbi:MULTISPECIES: TRAP transporter large permease [unclassified Microbacterium]|uniref:TRAP transporter large permease n=1 Tax=unclassified Microbacterium TaxID=2609290 RepID=UPI00214AD5FB|nr:MULTISPECIES: TRAP transporter large permease [unclassified Microbacterium]MCR2811371.1 TRAP transporter large permease [Microbacterium sp. zg.B185]WIM19583.1 TRAP transporter large permease [Microbacterium sp. zg-B185]
MSIELTAIIVFGLLFSLMAIRMPVGLALLVAGGVGIVLNSGLHVGMNVAGQSVYKATSNYVLFVIPMFILLGAIVLHAGLGARLFSVANRLVGRAPGGLAASTVVAVTVFSGVSGSSAADVAAFGKLSVGQMRRHGYDPAVAASVVAAAGCFAVLIPPNVGIVVYGILSEQSIGALLLAGVIPGLVSCAVLAVAVIVRAKLWPTKLGSEAVRPEKRLSTGLSDDERSLRTISLRSQVVAALYALVLFVIVMGGIYSGNFTSAEAGAMGAFTAVIIALFTVRGRLRKFGTLMWRSLGDTLSTSSMIFLLLIGGTVFNYFIASSGLASRIVVAMSSIDIPPLLLAAVFLLMLLVLGMFLDGLSTMLIVVPLVTPVVMAVGLDPLWFGILALKAIEIGLLTPPLGINVFVISGLLKDVSAESVFRQVTPFIVLDLAVTAAFFTFPGLILWLPQMAGIT